MNIQGREALVTALFFALLLPLGWFLFMRAEPLPDQAATAVPAAPATTHGALVRLVADDWCPVSCEAAGDMPEGYAVEMARAALTAAGYRVEYSLQPWARAVNETRKGSVDGIIGILQEGATDFVYPQETIGTNTNVFFTRADESWQYDGIASLDRIVVGVANEYEFGEPFDSYVRQNRDDGRRLQVLFTQDPVGQGIGMLGAGRIGAYLDDRMVVNWTMSRHKLPLKVREAGEVSSIPLYVAFSPAHPRARELAAAFDAGVRSMRANGELASLLAKYGITDWAGKP